LVPLLLIGCLERVTGEDVPLDPRFYEGGQDAQGTPNPEGNGGPGGGEAPWSGYDGATLTLAGEVVVDGTGEVQIDVNTPDADAPGGQQRQGALRIPGSGAFELKIPEELTEVRFQAFQDSDADGPDEDDPFAEVTWKASDGNTVTLTLAKGARGRAGAPGGAPGGAPPGAPGGTGAPPPPDGLSFPAGDMVSLSGTVTTSRDLPVVLDFFHSNGEGAGGRSYLGKRVVPPGAWSQEFPVDYGPVEVEAYQDLTGDSRTGDDPSGRTERPLTIADTDVSGISLTIP
jgi:hypothetical protein